MFNFSFAFIAASVQIVGTHASFVLADRRHGTQLAESFTKLEILFPIDKKTLEQVRSVTVAAVVITIFLVETFYCFIMDFYFCLIFGQFLNVLDDSKAILFSFCSEFSVHLFWSFSL